MRREVNEDKKKEVQLTLLCPCTKSFLKLPNELFAQFTCALATLIGQTWVVGAFTAPVSSLEGEKSLYNMQTVDRDRLLCVRKFA